MAHQDHAATSLRSESGFSLLELLIAIAVLMAVSGTVFDGVLRLTKQSATINNRTAMHAGVRNATELMQQEVGQAGRVATKYQLRLGDWAPAGPLVTVPLQALDKNGNVLTSVSAVAGLFVGEKLVVGTGSHEETVEIASINTVNNRITANFLQTHGLNSPVNVYGGFAAGVVPTTITNGSTGSVLKIFGDINSDGNLEYVEYTCDTTNGFLYRRTMPFNATSKPAIAPEMALLNNIKPNPDGTPCFTYQQRTVNNVPYVVDVAITLTVETPDPDPVSGLYQEETKALLNVAPRNVFNVWQLAGLGISNRVQPTPASVTALLGLP